MLHNVCSIYCCNFPVHQSALVSCPDVNNLYHTMSVNSSINVEMLIGLQSINFTTKRIATRMLIELSTAECKSSCTVVCIGGASFSAKNVQSRKV